MVSRFFPLLSMMLVLNYSFGQKIKFNDHVFELKNVNGSIVSLQGSEVLKLERNLQAIPFDANRLEETVDEPTFAKLTNFKMENGTIEVKMLSQIQNPSPFINAQGFIGLAFRISENDSMFESIYLRPKIGRSYNQSTRNRAIQYFAYPHAKFNTLRKSAPGKYESTATVGLNEWITMRIEIKDKKAEMFINNAPYSNFVVDSLLGKGNDGAIGLFVDIGTIGYFKDLKIIPKQKSPSNKVILPLRRVFQPTHEMNKIPYGANDAVGSYVQSGDAKIYYELYGKGNPIVLLHGGIFGSSIEMTPFIDSLKKDHQVIAISTRGHGKSEIGLAPITYDKKANDVMTVIDAVTKDSVIILGFSDGAYTGYKVASLFPHRIKKLVAIGAGEQIPGLRKVDFDPTVIKDLDPLYWEQQFTLMPQPERFNEFLKLMEDFYNSMTAGKDLFSSIRCPVLLVSGEKDRNAPLSSVINAYNMIPKSQLLVVPNAGHVVFYDNFLAVWAGIKPFLGSPEIKSK